MKKRFGVLPLFALAACAAPIEDTRPVVAPPVAAAAVQTSGPLLGLSSAATLTRLGQPVLQVREGSGLMLQFRAPGCVLDAYLYPDARGAETVTHVDARRPDGQDVDRDLCIAAIERARTP
ncbi:hypothetical protein WJT74_12065 [Sphingomicrobium sp. XHP0239]|uniref:hypothetical protein n=1 Tax=Sphingomicrobium maritimum TaxID=3133972 RepID=UPI0031CCCB62